MLLFSRICDSREFLSYSAFRYGLLMVVRRYELLKWEETLQIQRGQPLRRELEWATIAREIALMNKPYSRQ